MGPVIEIFSYVLWVVLALTLLVFVHEAGHFLAAKLFGMRVDRFSIGFPPVIAGKKWGETEYVVGATPLGGYVKIAGMIDESMDTDFVGSEPEPHEFRAKPVWQRIVVITAGVVFNVILAMAIYTGLKMTYGETYVPADNVEAVYVEEESVAYRMGLRTGDRVVAVNDEPLRDIQEVRALSPETLTADSLTVTVEREGQRRTFTAPPNVMTQLARAARQGEGFGVSYLPPVVAAVQEGSPAEEAGLRTGDRITAVGGEPVRFWSELTEKVEARAGQPLVVRWTRPERELGDAPGGGTPEGGTPGARPDSARAAARRTASTGSAAQDAGFGAPEQAAAPPGGGFEARITPRYDSTAGRYLLGIGAATPAMLEEELGVRRVSYGPGAALVAGARQTWTTTTSIVESLRRVFFGRDSFRANVGGPVEIARVTKQAADAGPRAFWSIVAFLSVTLAIMNILPIPALDGGHLMFLLYEGITRRRPSEKVRMALQQIGFVVLIVFMAFVIFNDILRL